MSETIAVLLINRVIERGKREFGQEKQIKYGKRTLQVSNLHFIQLGPEKVNIVTFYKILFIDSMFSKDKIWIKYV